MTLSIESGATTEANVGTYSIKLTLVDALGVSSDILTLSLEIVSPEQVEEQVEVESDAVVISNDFEFDASKYSKTGSNSDSLNGANLGLSDGERMPPPTAEIESISNGGSVRISFSNPMTLV